MDCGNSFAGLYGAEQEGKMRASFLMKQYAKMGYKVVAVGAKDLDLPLDFLKKEAAENGLLLVAANVYKDLKRVFMPYIIEDVDGVKIAFIGIVDGSAIRYRSKKDFAVEDALMELKGLKLELDKERPDIFVLLTDIPAVQLKKMLGEINWIDIAIVSGRGTTLRNPLEAGGTHILSPAPKGKAVGIATIEISPEKEILNVSNKMIFLKKNVSQDEDVAKEVKRLVSMFPKRDTRGVNNPFLRALMSVKKRRQRALNAQSTRTNGTSANATVTNPFLEILKGKELKGADNNTSN